MAEPLELRYSRTYPAGVEQAYDALIGASLPEIFDQRFLLIPPISEVRDQSGPWEQPGVTRTVVLSDGGTMRERLTLAEHGERFGYRLDEVTGMLRPLVEHVDGEWSFARAGSGVRVTWMWQVCLSGRLGALCGPVLARLWRGYARRAFDRIEGVLVGDTRPPRETPPRQV